MAEPLAIHDYTRDGLDAALEFVKRTRAELRSLRKARVWRDRMQIIDVNKDYFEIRGIGYSDADVIPLLKSVNAAFDPDTVQTPTEAEYKEFDTRRRHPWAEDRVM